MNLFQICGNSSNEGTFYQEDADRCHFCKSSIGGFYIPKTIAINANKFYDISYTIDLQTVFSKKFVDHCCKFLQIDDVFHQIKNVGGGEDVFYIYPSRVLEFDTIRRRTKFIEKCDSCKKYKSIIGATPIFLKTYSSIENQFYRTDIEFGESIMQHSLLITNEHIKQSLDKQKFRGIYFRKIANN